MCNNLKKLLPLQEIKAFVSYQEMLFAAFTKKFDDLSEEQLTYLHRLPEKKGKVNDEDGNSWIFEKHGEGVRFEQEKDGLVIDIDRSFQEIKKFDAGRLCWYLESLHNVEISTREVSKILDSYVSKGAIKKEKNNLFSLN